MFSNLKIGKRLALAFGISIVLVAVAGLTGFWGLSQTVQTNYGILHHDAKLMQEASQSQVNGLELGRNEKDSFLNIGDRQKSAADADQWSKEHAELDSHRVLAAARDGVWPVERSNDIPERLRKAYMLRGLRSEEGRMRAHPSLQSMITFRRINLNDADYGIRETFDLLFCRNVLIYFNRESKERVIQRLVRHLSGSGLPFLGHSESLAASTFGMEHAGPTVYRRSGS